LLAEKATKDKNQMLWGKSKVCQNYCSEFDFVANVTKKSDQTKNASVTNRKIHFTKKPNCDQKKRLDRKKQAPTLRKEKTPSRQMSHQISKLIK